MNVAIVPCMSASGAGSISSVCVRRRATRAPAAGARAGVALLRTDEPELPVLAAAGGGGRDARCGSGRRGGSTGSTPCHARNLPYDSGAPPAATCAAIGAGGRCDAIASVARNSSTSAPSATTTSATIWPGSACSSSDGEQQPGLRGAGVADGRRRGRRSPARRRASRRAERATRWPGRDDAGDGDVACGERRPTRARRSTPHAERHVRDLAERSSQTLRARLARRAPALDELVGDARARRGARRRPGRRRRCRPRTRRRRRRLPLPRRCRAARCARRRYDERGAAAPGEREQERADRRARRRAEVERGPSAASRSAAWTGGGVGLVGVRREGGGEQQLRGDERRVLAQREARGLDAPSWWSPRRAGDGAGALAAALADERCDLASRSSRR